MENTVDRTLARPAFLALLRNSGIATAKYFEHADNARIMRVRVLVVNERVAYDLAYSWNNSHTDSKITPVHAYGRIDAPVLGFDIELLS